MLAVEWHGMKASSNEVPPATTPCEVRAQGDLRTKVRLRSDILCDGRGRVAFGIHPTAPLSHDSVVHRSAYREDPFRVGAKGEAEMGSLAEWARLPASRRPEANSRGHLQCTSRWSVGGCGPI